MLPLYWGPNAALPFLLKGNMLQIILFCKCRLYKENDFADSVYIVKTNINQKPQLYSVFMIASFELTI